MKKAKTLDENQLKRLLILTESGNNGLRNKTILTLSFYCGLRSKELAALKVSDILNDVADTYNIENFEFKRALTQTEANSISSNLNTILRYLGNKK